MTGLPRFGHFSSPSSADALNKYPSRQILLHKNDMAEPTQPLYINMLHNVYIYVVEELKYLTIESNAENIANSHWTDNLIYDFSLEYSQGCISA